MGKKRPPKHVFINKKTPNYAPITRDIAGPLVIPNHSGDLSAGFFRDLEVRKSATISGSLIVKDDLDLGGDINTNGTFKTSNSIITEQQTLQSYWAFKFKDGLGADDTGVFFNITASQIEWNIVGTTYWTVNVLGKGTLLGAFECGGAAQVDGNLTLGDGSTGVISRAITFNTTTTDGSITWQQALPKFVFSHGLRVGGDIEFTGAQGEGLSYGEIYVKDNVTATTISSIGVPVKFTGFTTNGLSNNATPDQTNNKITIAEAGIYKINVSAVIESVGGGGIVARGAIRIASLSGANLHFNRNMSGGGGDKGSVSITGLCDCSINDDIEFYIANDSSTTNITISDMTINVVKIGAT